jgi:type IV pilus assembly protein PilW
MNAASALAGIPQRARPRRVGGYTLVEILIAMVLGLIVVAGLEQIYVSGRVVNRIIDNTGTLTENGRFAMEFFARDIRLAGYFSCGGAKAVLANALNEETFWTRLQGIDGYDGGTDIRAAEPLPDVFDALPDPLDGRDVLVLRYADLRRAMVVDAGGHDPGNDRFLFDTTHPFARGDVLVLNDAACHQTAVFQVMGAYNEPPVFYISYDPDATTAVPGNCTDNLAGEYDCDDPDRALAERQPADNFVDAEVTPLILRAFFVALQPADECTPSVDDCAAVSRCPTLYVMGTDVPGAVPVLRDVADLEITYGVDTDIVPHQMGSGDADVDAYLDAHEIRAQDVWHQVISVRIRLDLINADCRTVDFVTTTALRNSATGDLLTY